MFFKLNNAGVKNTLELKHDWHKELKQDWLKELKQDWLKELKQCWSKGYPLT